MDIEPTDLAQLKAISDWLSDDNELPSSGDASCVMNAVDEITALREIINNMQQDELKFYKDDLIVMEFCGDICLGHVEHAVNDTACIVIGTLRRWYSNDELNERKAKVVGKRIFKKRFGLFKCHVDVFFEN